jgi:tetratricopeptide (TPR) repeat protein
MVAYFLPWIRGLATPAADELRLAAQHARNAADDGLRERALAGYVGVLRYGRRDARTIAEELDAIERENPGPYLAASVASLRSEVARLDGRSSEARRLAQRATAGFRSLGISEREVAYDQLLGRMELLAGDPAAALAALQRSDAILAQLGERGLRSTTQAFLAHAHALLGNTDAARAAIELTEELGDAQDVVNFIITHGVRARLALADGDGATAERWARSAVNYASRTDDIVDQANTRLDLARVLAALERPEHATSEASEALNLFLTKGDRPGTNQTRALLEELGPRA